MVEPLQRPRRKDPLKRTRKLPLPPSNRSRSSHILTLAAAQGRFAIQCCKECGTLIYPVRDACPECLSCDFELKDIEPKGTVVSETKVRVSADPYFRERAPWRIGMVHLAGGPLVIAHLHEECGDGDTVRMSLQLDKAGQAVFFARPEQGSPHWQDDTQWREMTAQPKFRRVLVTNGRTAIGQAVANALANAGAKVYVGLAEDWKPFSGEEALRRDHTIVPLDVADERSVQDLVADLGGKIDILINTGEHVRAGGLTTRQGTAILREELEQRYLGFVHLAQAFGPAMRERGADGVISAVAWVNILSVYALGNWAPFGSFSAVEAACLSLSHCLRAELRPGGVRVVNVFTGPTDTEWFQLLPPPKVAPKALADAIVKALNQGTEDVYVGDVADDVRRRLEANPKALERELGQ